MAHKPSHMLRAVVEGLACELARNLKSLTAAGLGVRRLILCGSAAASRVTPRILADVTGYPVVCMPRKAASAWGAAVVAQAMLQPDTDLADLARNQASTAQTVEPGKEASVYSPLLEQYLQPFKKRGMK